MSSLENRLLSQVNIQENGCWIFTGCCGSFGYGSIYYNGFRDGAHRISFRLYKGVIPEDKYVCHSCDQPACVNPNHLFLGTHIDNIKDMWNKGRGVHQDTRGELNGQARLYVKDVLDIRALDAEGYSLADIGRIFGVDITTIWKIKHRKTWRHI